MSRKRGPGRSHKQGDGNIETYTKSGKKFIRFEGGSTGAKLARKAIQQTLTMKHI